MTRYLPLIIVLVLAVGVRAQPGVQLDAEIAKHSSQLDELRSRLAAVGTQLEDHAARLSALDARLSALSPLAGVRELSEPIVIPRQTALKVPAPFMASSTISPAGDFGGVSPTQTVLRFAATVKGPLIQSEKFGDPALSAWWNDGATLTCFAPRVHDLSIDGRGTLHPHPYINNKADQSPDEYGADAPVRGAGVCLQGTGVIAERLRLFQIQGTALVVRGAPIAGQSGQFGLFDEAVSRIDDVTVLQCWSGIDSNAGDSRISRVSVSQVAKDGLTVSGPGTYIDDYHCWGADRSLVASCEIHATQLYCEAARIGLHLAAGSTNSTIDGCNIGPATCWQKGVSIEADCIQLHRLAGSVSGAAVVGCDLAAATTECDISGKISAYNQAAAFVVRGHHHTLRLVCNLANGATAVKVIGPVRNVRVELIGWGPEGTAALDLSEAQLQGGCVFDVRFNGPAKRVIYPSGSTSVPAGNTLTIDGAGGSRK